MKTLLLCMTGIFLAVTAVNAQTSVTTTVTSDGRLHQYVPGTSFVVQETSGPIAYQYGPSVVYATSGGAILTPEQVQARIRVGVPVRVEYANEGETRIIKRVIVREEVDNDDDDDDN